MAALGLIRLGWKRMMGCWMMKEYCGTSYHQRVATECTVSGGVFKSYRYDDTCIMPLHVTCGVSIEPTLEWM